MKKTLYVTPCTDEITIHTEANFVATGDFTGGGNGTNNQIEDLGDTETDADNAIWS